MKATAKHMIWRKVKQVSLFLEILQYSIWFLVDNQISTELQREETRVNT